MRADLVLRLDPSLIFILDRVAWKGVLIALAFGFLSNDHSLLDPAFSVSFQTHSRTFRHLFYVLGNGQGVGGATPVHYPYTLTRAFYIRIL
jgi:hypothetical protein